MRVLFQVQDSYAAFQQCFSSEEKQDLPLLRYRNTRIFLAIEPVSLDKQHAADEPPLASQSSSFCQGSEGWFCQRPSA
jgi:hypothetical protein